MDSMMIFCEMEDMLLLPLYATTIGYWEHQGEMARPAGFPDYQLHQVLGGKGEVNIRGKSYLAEAGDLFCLYPDVPHSYTPLSREWELAWISFNGREAAQMLLYAGIRESGVGRLRAEPILAPLEEMLTLSSGNELQDNLERSKLLYALLLDLKRSLLPASNEDNELARMKPVLQYIELHLHRPLLLKELAEVASVSPQYLCRLFQRTVRERPVAYINKQRVNRSKQLMFSSRGQRIYEIAQRAGFENVSYFCAVFKRITGMQPEEWRGLHGLD
ncbi:AraC family transcriptional regulator [Paenibacillus sp. FSL H3-0469]|uniref:AraC family transcriptional regulator n=1 Tax=Paenibacillus sp. FSL H3-0469 TaxID=2954506 RepID=UPI003100B2B4